MIQQVSFIKYMGVRISDDLSCGLPTFLTSALEPRSYWVSFNGTSGSLVLGAYPTFTKPWLEYCSCVWDPRHANSVSKLQTDSDYLLTVVGWPLLANRRKFLKLCLCRKNLEGFSIIPPDVFLWAPESNRLQLSRPLVRTNYHQSSYFVSVATLWNTIPDHIVTLQTCPSFKRHLKKFLVV